MTTVSEYVVLMTNVVISAWPALESFGNSVRDKIENTPIIPEDQQINTNLNQSTPPPGSGGSLDTSI